MIPKVMYKSDASYVSCRAGIYYYTRRDPFVDVFTVGAYNEGLKLSLTIQT
ncbi:hypothetical protein OBB02_01120 [Candidatus Puniceispirillum sp.]|nr:hypothetical protein [Candidatus Puniceispirillum sp.]